MRILLLFNKTSLTVSFISNAAHQKFISQCDRLVVGEFHNINAGVDKEMNELIKKDLAKLHQLAEDYLNTISSLTRLTNEYNNLQRQIRINIRKMQIAKKQ